MPFSVTFQNLKIDNNLVAITENLNIFDTVLKSNKKIWKTPKYHQNKKEDEKQEHVLFF